MFRLNDQSQAALASSAHSFAELLAQWAQQLPPEQKTGVAHAMAAGGKFFVSFEFSPADGGEYSLGILAADGTRVVMGSIPMVAASVQ